MTTKDLEQLVERARKIEMTPEQREAQRRSFVYGTTKLENKYITEELVNEVGEELLANARAKK